MTALVLVSHSAQIAEGAAALAKQMAADVQILPAGGTDDAENPIGTDAVKIMTAIESAGEDCLILVDLGSAILSAQTALDLLDSETAAHCRISAAPLVEGAVTAAAALQGGADLREADSQARQALAPKKEALGDTDNSTPAAGENETFQHAQSVTLTVHNASGLHARPIAALIRTLKDFDAELRLEHGGKTADARKMIQAAALGVPCGGELTLLAAGKDAAAAIEAFKTLVQDNFGESR